MKTTWKFQNSDKLTFDFIHPGQAFLWEGDLYIRSAKGNTVIDPSDGELYKFDDTDEVQVVQAEIVVSTGQA